MRKIDIRRQPDHLVSRQARWARNKRDAARAEREERAFRMLLAVLIVLAPELVRRNATLFVHAYREGLLR